VLEHTYTSPFDSTILLLDDIPLSVELAIDPPLVVCSLAA
jgi:hypothetical protein